MDFVIAESLSKRFVAKERLGLFKTRRKIVEALSDVSFRIPKGTLFSLVGPNGAGKTTTVRILATLLLPDSGEAYVGGFDVVKEAARVKEIVGVMLYPDRGFFGRLSGFENLVYYGMLYGLDRREARRRARELLELVGLAEAGNRPYEEYSMGMKARLGLAKALINDPQLLLLDEPTVGVDPIGARRIREAIRAMKRGGKTILFTSHNLYEVEELSDKIAIIAGGKIITIGTPQEIKSKLGFRPRVLVTLRCKGDFPYGVTENGEVKIDEEVERPVQMLTEIIREAEARNCEVVEAAIKEPSLEEVVIKTISGR